MQVTTPADLPMVSPFWENYSGARSAAPNSHKVVTGFTENDCLHGFAFQADRLERKDGAAGLALFNLEGAHVSRKLVWALSSAG